LYSRDAGSAWVDYLKLLRKKEEEEEEEEKDNIY
jgi:hypothetical protein